MAFNGYLLKKPNASVYFPENLIEWGSWSSSPKRRQDKDSTRDMTGVLHRTVVAAMPSTIKFTTRDGLHLADKQAIQNFFSSCMVSSAERKVYVEFWNDEDNVYQREYMYLPDIEFPIMWHDGNDIVYSAVDFELIGYGN